MIELRIEKFWSLVNKNGPNWNGTACWLWLGGKSGTGYGMFNFQDKAWLVHRLAYTLLRGEIPTPLVIDHLCRTLACVNPDHLEPVTFVENLRRGKHAHVIQ